MEFNTFKAEIDTVNGADGKAAGKPNMADLSVVQGVEVELQVKLGTISVTVEQLISLANRDVLKMNQDINAPVEIFLGENCIALGNLVAIEDHFGIEITNVDNG